MNVNRPGPSPVALDAQDDALEITWSDGPVRRHAYAHIRRSCRCAQCVEEVTGRALLDPASVPDDIHPVSIEPVGSYAIRFVWSDGHGTGIFTYAHLRGLPEESKPGPP